MRWKKWLCSTGQWTADRVGEDGTIPERRPEWVGSTIRSARDRQGRGLDRLVVEKVEALAKSTRAALRRTKLEDLRW